MEDNARPIYLQIWTQKIVTTRQMDIFIGIYKLVSAHNAIILKLLIIQMRQLFNYMD